MAAGPEDESKTPDDRRGGLSLQGYPPEVKTSAMPSPNSTPPSAPSSVSGRDSEVRHAQVSYEEADDVVHASATVESPKPLSPADVYPFPPGSSIPSAVALAAARNDDPWDKSKRDRLSVNDDAKAFARLAMMRSFRPPLAVGIFGSWGAGKSFFMRLIHEHIDRLQAGTPSFEAPEAGATDFHGRVVQIRFNAWHYAETNLWASLVGHIFQELSTATADQAGVPVLSRLSTARELTLEAAQEFVSRARERNAALETYNQAKKDAELLQYRIDPIAATKAAVVAIFNDDSDSKITAAREDLAVAAKELGLDGLVASQRQLTEAGAALLSDGVTASQQLASMFRRGTSPQALLVFLALFAVAVLAVPWAVQQAATLLGIAPSWLRDTVVHMSGLFLMAGAGLSYLRHPIAIALKRLKQAKGVLDELVEKRKKTLEASASERKTNVEGAEVRLKAAGEHLKSVMERLAVVSDELYGQTPGNRLINFVRARATDGSYAQHLGLISTVRKDFEQLSTCLEDNGVRPNEVDDLRFKQQVERLISDADGDLTDEEKKSLRELVAKEPPKDEAPAIQRIVLYIDDLDRCPPDKVIEVLQAVHMLLAFRLFVVFVAVDVRWVAASLAKQYAGLLHGTTPPAGMTSASDYLEKIFQLPYWVPELNSDTATNFFWSTLGFADQTALDETYMRLANAPPTQPVSVQIGELLQVEAQLLAPYVQKVQSPRKLLRLLNLARLFKVSGYVFDSSSGRPTPKSFVYAHALIAQATIATAVPDFFAEWMELLSSLEQNEGSVDEQVSKAPIMKDCREGRLVLRLIEEFSAHADPMVPYGNGLPELLYAGRIAQRFSFAQQLQAGNDVDYPG